MVSELNWGYLLVMLVDDSGLLVGAICLLYVLYLLLLWRYARLIYFSVFLLRCLLD